MGEWCNGCNFDIPDDQDALAVTVPRKQNKKPEKWIVCSQKCARAVAKRAKQDIRDHAQWLLDQVTIIKMGRV